MKLLAYLAFLLSSAPDEIAAAPEPDAGAIAEDQIAYAGEVFLSPEQALALLRAESVRVIDARGRSARRPYLPHTVTLDWRDFREGGMRSGKLISDTKGLAAKLEKVGISTGETVLVYGAMADGWGEEGRIWWMLRYLGHPRVFILDGGIGAWVAAGQPTARSDHDVNERGDFNVSVQADSRALAKTISQTEVPTLVLDTRRAEEYAGARPYLSRRGGHIPGAVHLEWKRFIGKDGRLLPKDELRRVAERVGVPTHGRVIAYCTGGVRSAFVAAVLEHAGYTDVMNYDGSWWEWAANPELPIEKD